SCLLGLPLGSLSPADARLSLLGKRLPERRAIASDARELHLGATDPLLELAQRARCQGLVIFDLSDEPVDARQETARETLPTDHAVLLRPPRRRLWGAPSARRGPQVTIAVLTWNDSLFPE